MRQRVRVRPSPSPYSEKIFNLKDLTLNIEKVIQDDRQAKLTVEYSTSEFEGYKRRAAKKISKKSKIPGFRPGKAPYNVILNHFGKEAILQEAIDIILDDDYAKFLEEAELKPSGAGSLETIENADPPKFIFLIPLEPEVELGDYRQIRKDYSIEEFDESKVDAYINNARRNAASIVPAERPAEKGDLVYFTLSGEFLNPEEEEDATITDKTPQQALIPEEDDIDPSEWPFPGFSQELIAIKAGDTKEIQHTYQEDYADEEFRGKTAVFTVDVQSVKALELPELDEDFVQTLGDFETPEGFRKAVEEGLRNDHQNQFDQTYFDELLTEITKESKIAYPPQMLEEQKDHLLHDLKARIENQNLDFETYLRLRGLEESKLIEEEILPTAKKRLERSLLIEALVKEEKIKLDQEKLQDEIQVVMREVFRNGDVGSMEKRLKDDNFSRAISMEAVNRTITDQLYERIKLIATGQPIPAEEEEILDETKEGESEVESVEELEPSSSAVNGENSEEEITDESDDSIQEEIEEKIEEI